MNNMKRNGFCITGLLVLTGWLAAQSDSSTIRGVASDPTGALVPNAKITLTGVETNIARDAVTTSDGVYEIPYLGRGTYRLVATGPGFKTFIAENILLTSAQIRRIDITFQLGEISTEVTVNANAAVINTEGAQIAGGFTSATYADSPNSVSMYPQAAALILPNVQAAGAGYSLRTAGQPAAQVVELLDGFANDGTTNNMVNNMNNFAEAQMVSVNASAEYARSGNFSLTNKSGTNEFHGDMMWDLITSALDARRFFDAVKPPSHENQAYVGVAGPIRKNRTFFYASYQLRRVPGGTYYNANVPTLAERGGDFSAFATIKDPLNGGAPFPGNLIPASRIAPLATTVQNTYIPKPTQGAANSISNNFGFPFPYPSDLYKGDYTSDRIDQKISDKNTLFGRYVNRITPYVLAGNYPNVGQWTRTRYDHNVVVTDTHIFSPTLVNTARWGWGKDDINDGGTVNGFTPVNGDAVVKTIGLQGVNPAGFSAMGFPDFQITGATELTVTGGGNTVARNFDYADSMTWARGAHVLKFGGELRTFRTFNSTVPTGTYGQFSFNGSFSGNGYADFLLGIPFSSSRLNPIVGRTERSYELGIFITDTWKINRKLTLDYGLRWDYFGPSTYRDGLQYNWDETSGNVVVPASELKMVSPLYPSTINVVTGQVVPNMSKKNWRPRLGFAYLLNPKTVVRGGYGLYSETQGNFANIQGGGPFQISQTYTNVITAGVPLFQMPNPYPSSGAFRVPSQSISGYPLNETNGIIQQFNVSVERQVKDIGLRLSYVGSRSSGLHYTVSIDKPQPSLIPFTQSRLPWPQYVGASFLQQDGKAKYDSVQIEASRKLGSLTFETNYTLANTMGNTFDLENPYNHNMWARDSGVARSRLVLEALYQFPFGRGRRWMNNAPRAVDEVLGGWRLMWISQFQQGEYFSPSFSGSDPSNTNSSGGLPDCISNGNLAPGQRIPTAWFNPAAFAAPPAGVGRFGNCGVNILEGPGLSQQNPALIKEFKITERWKVEFQAMVQDLFNSAWFTNPAANISVPGQVARITGLLAGANPSGNSTQSSRSMQFRLRIIF